MSAAPRSPAQPVIRCFASVVLLSVAFAITADAAEKAAVAATQARPTGGHAGSQFLAAWDDDGDDKVSRAEYDKARVQRFAFTDANKDGGLSVDEYLNEYATRLDPQIADERQASIKQTHTRFNALDKDHDGFIARTEYDLSGAQSFEHLDTQKTGQISEVPKEADETNEARPQRRSVIRMPSSHTRAGFVEIYDADGDGVLTRAQYDTERAKVFAATDANKDGKLDVTEYVAEFSARLDLRIADSRQAQLKQGKVRFNAIDDDKSGAIGRDEYLAMSARMFERTDTNKDGVVSKEDPAPLREERSANNATAKP